MKILRHGWEMKSVNGDDGAVVKRIERDKTIGKDDQSVLMI